MTHSRDSLHIFSDISLNAVELCELTNV